MIYLWVVIQFPFLFFERDQQTAGDIIRPLMQAEMGMLWLDEQGIIKFIPRLEIPNEPVYAFDTIILYLLAQRVMTQL